MDILGSLKYLYQKPSNCVKTEKKGKRKLSKYKETGTFVGMHGILPDVLRTVVRQQPLKLTDDKRPAVYGADAGLLWRKNPPYVCCWSVNRNPPGRLPLPTMVVPGHDPGDSWVVSLVASLGWASIINILFGIIWVRKVWKVQIWWPLTHGGEFTEITLTEKLIR